MIASSDEQIVVVHCGPLGVWLPHDVKNCVSVVKIEQRLRRFKPVYYVDDQVL